MSYIMHGHVIKYNIINNKIKIKGGPGVFGISKFTTLVNKLIKIYKMGFFDYINPKAAPS